MLSVVAILPVIAASVLAQDMATNNSISSKLELEAIQAHFTNADLVPALMQDFQPSAILDAAFPPIGKIHPGQNLTINDVKFMPTLTLNAIDPTVKFADNYTVIMVDAGAVGTDQSNGQTRHWLVNNVVSNQDNTLVFNDGVSITNYAGPFPKEGSGPHRYVILVYLQPVEFSPEQDLAKPNQPVGVMDLNQYITSSALGALLAGNYFDVQLSTTSPVETSTLPDASSTADVSVNDTAEHTSRTHGNFPTNGASCPTIGRPLYFLIMLMGLGVEAFLDAEFP